ncbi:histone H2A [Thecamonas trahens ATCC 50062]|uniref:Histone H2A n=1 Tax=Thecamonas trahens ATCC 50062 TaxID=461836 RepID=A0A0L0DEE7_THETB|nr:histone H2A [Thecamonas trahens ATCC 50062]KNC50674.1 histone H2A [Thecamonas trahens ATCC 50062]|eukprot:XP_013762554.1 histone H2A [Thecamonas trahens ATCC 50062]
MARTRRRETFASYIYKVLKQVHPDAGISKQGMTMVNAFVFDTLRQIVELASRIMPMMGKTTVSSREIQTAVRIVIQGELTKHAVAEGCKAVTKFSGSGSGYRSTTRSTRAGLQFPVGRIHRYMRAIVIGRVSGSAPVYLAAVLEYLVAEIVELSGNAARAAGRMRITPIDLETAIGADAELAALVGNSLVLRKTWKSVAQGGDASDKPCASSTTAKPPKGFTTPAGAAVAALKLSRDSARIEHFTLGLYDDVRERLTTRLNTLLGVVRILVEYRRKKTISQEDVILAHMFVEGSVPYLRFEPNAVTKQLPPSGLPTAYASDTFIDPEALKSIVNELVASALDDLYLKLKIKAVARTALVEIAHSWLVAEEAEVARTAQQVARSPSLAVIFDTFADGSAQTSSARRNTELVAEIDRLRAKASTLPAATAAQVAESLRQVMASLHSDQ